MKVSKANQAHIDDQTHRFDRVICNILRIVCASPERWSLVLPVVEFAWRNAVHVCIVLTNIYVIESPPKRHVNTTKAWM